MFSMRPGNSSFFRFYREYWLCATNSALSHPPPTIVGPDTAAPRLDAPARLVDKGRGGNRAAATDVVGCFRMPSPCRAGEIRLPWSRR